MNISHISFHTCVIITKALETAVLFCTYQNDKRICKQD